MNPFRALNLSLCFSDSDSDLEDGSRSGKPLAESTPAVAAARKAPKPKYHTSLTGRGVTAGTARPRFSSSSESDASGHEVFSDHELASSDLDTDFSADEKTMTSSKLTPASSKRASKLTPKVAALKEAEKNESTDDEAVSTPTLKLKIKLPSTSTETETPKSHGAKSGNRRKQSLLAKTLKGSSKLIKKSDHYGFAEFGPPGRKKSTDEWSTSNHRRGGRDFDNSSTSDSDNDDSDNLVMDESDISVNAMSSSSAAAAAATHEAAAISDKLYCVCQCPHDDVSEMIGCDAPDCRLEWFHFECVGILVPPKGQWFCPECRDRYKIKNKSFW